VAANQLKVAGNLDNLAKIGEFVTAAARRAGLNDKAVYAVQMAVDEACANIIEHAYGGEGRGSIRLACAVQTDGLQIIILDRGRPFNLAKVPALDTAAPLEKRQVGGMGIFFIHTLMDRVEFKFTARGNQLILFKRRETAP
jgi:serine/threonine-protein kinase RsbW